MKRLTDLRFRTKVLLAAMLPLALTAGLNRATAWYFTQNLRKDASQLIADGLTQANDEHLSSYLSTTAQRVDQILQQHVDDVEILADAMQGLSREASAREALGVAMAPLSSLREELIWVPPDEEEVKGELWPTGGWSQTAPGGATVTTVWGPEHSAPGVVSPQALEVLQATAAFEILGPAVQREGGGSLQMYFIGPEAAPVFRAAPDSRLGQGYDLTYKGHNTQPYWRSLFPGLMQDWSIRARNSGTDSVHITLVAPYVDGTTGKHVISMMHPVWPAEGDTPAGAVGVDIALEQITSTIEGVRIAQSGFAFLMDTDGEVLAVTEEGQKVLGLTTHDDDFHTPGVAAVTRRLSESSQPGVRELAGKLELNDDVPFEPNLELQTAEGTRSYRVAAHGLRAFFEWRADHVRLNHWVLVFVVPEDEVLAPLSGAVAEIDQATRSSAISQTIVNLLSLLIVLLAVARISRAMVSDLDELTEAAKGIRVDHAARVSVDSEDEFGQLGRAFNEMAEQIEEYTRTLEQKVAERTQALSEANARISDLYAQLEQENQRLEAELDVARRIQAMVLPSDEELAAVQALDVAGFMLPADEVGGDYYDVMPLPGGVKLGIGDVTGHGLRSGVLMLMVQSTARTLLDAGVKDPVRFLSILNTVIYNNIQRINTDTNLTLSFIDFDGETLTLVGQHEELLLARADGRFERIDTMDLGLPVGILPDIQEYVHTLQVPFAPGDVAVLFTDGVTEAEDTAGELYGLERLCALVQGCRELDAQAIKERIITSVRAHVGEQRIFDDISLLIVKRQEA
ncbi:MAG: SpoIIE family protein phosphatase [Alphaproteobacteria bacterium]|nr:SpoIIE family protein phosphatase [Alphaproteobacteria bacterium]